MNLFGCRICLKFILKSVSHCSPRYSVAVPACCAPPNQIAFVGGFANRPLLTIVYFISIVAVTASNRGLVARIVTVPASRFAFTYSAACPPPARTDFPHQLRRPSISKHTICVAYGIRLPYSSTILNTSRVISAPSAFNSASSAFNSSA